MKFDRTTVILTLISMLGGAYQYYLIYLLEAKVTDLTAQLHRHFPLHKLSESNDVSTTASLRTEIRNNQIAHTTSDFLKAKSPAPIVPAWSKPDEKEKRNVAKTYGGAGDEQHLGGFTQRDNNTISYNVWNYMLGPLAVKSFMDIGCGKGFSTSYFKENGAKVLCLEGSHDAIKHSLLPRSDIIQHDFSKGPWWPEETYDVAYSTEFLEHVGRQYSNNYMPTFKRAALVMVTSSGWGGYHHVEVHHVDWWVARFEAQGLVYSDELTKAVRGNVGNYRQDGGQILGSIMVFINPMVASLPKHAHLIGGNGCYGSVIDNHDNGVPCTGVDTLPAEFQSLLACRKVPTESEKDMKNLRWSCARNKDAKISD